MCKVVKIMVKVSVIMPSLNVVNYIDECILSVINQTLQDIEIICVDAGSTDGTREKLEEYRRKDNRISIIDSPVKSYGAQVNLGIRMSNGEYIGVVDTDDYIMPNMYSKLYCQAKEINADVSKGDHKRLTLSEGGKPFFSIGRVFDRKDNMLYNICLTERDISTTIYINDIVMWNGIYRRRFLLDNNIYLNESPGAAYQDIGFLHQVHMFARSIIFSDDILYCYREDRPDSSTNKSVWLRNVYQEYQFLFKGDLIANKKWFFSKKYAAGKIGFMFVVELERSIINSKYLIEDVPWLDYYEKLRGVIQRWVDDGNISEHVLPKEKWIILLLALYSLESYRNYTKVKSEDVARKKKRLIEQCRNKNCVIFGSGIRGKNIYRSLKENDVNVIAFFDNDKNKWGNEYQNIPIVQPTSVLDDNVTAYVVAIRGGEDNIFRQLKELGVLEENIYYFDW